MNQFQVGDVKITRIIESEAPWPGTFIMPDAIPENVKKEADWLYPIFSDEKGKLRMSIHALVLESQGKRIIVDTCIGNEKVRSNPAWSNLKLPFLSDLEKAGHTREQIDRVVCTHLHVDHVGWNTMLVEGKWVPTFPRARYLMGRVEFDHWSRPHGREDMVAVFGDSVQPVFDAGLVDLVEMDARLSDEISLIPTVGHTPGHVSVRILSRGQEALITGDFMHHPCQIAHPEWASTADSDAAQGQRTRERMFAELAGAPVLVIGTHFAGATAGRIVRDGGAYRLDV
jgi:glyoxylase-like metal-dependent hydrolase (beta-lactamase superfamily II)